MKFVFAGVLFDTDQATLVGSHVLRGGTKETFYDGRSVLYKVVESKRRQPRLVTYPSVSHGLNDVQAALGDRVVIEKLSHRLLKA